MRGDHVGEMALVTRQARLVALEMMSYRLIYNSEALARFRQEAEILRGLDHENIARLKRLFPAFNTYFLVMELNDGVDLGRLVRARGQLSEWGQECPSARPGQTDTHATLSRRDRRRR